MTPPPAARPPSRAFAQRKWSLAKRNFSFARRAAPMLVALAAALTLADSFTWPDRRHTNLTVPRVYARCIVRQMSSDIPARPYTLRMHLIRGAQSAVCWRFERGVPVPTRARHIWDGVLCVTGALGAFDGDVCALVVSSGWTKSQTLSLCKTIPACPRQLRRAPPLQRQALLRELEVARALHGVVVQRDERQIDCTHSVD